MLKTISKVLIAGAVVGLTACGEKNQSSTEAAKGNVTLRVSWWGGDERHNLTLEAIKAFEAKNQGIKVVPEYSGWQGHTEKIATQIVGNTAPDVMQVNWDWLFTFSKNGTGFYDLNQVKDIVKTENYTPAILESTTINGKLNAIPQGVSGKVFYYNETTYAKAGLEVPKTFEDMKKAAPIMKSKLGPQYYPFDLDQYGAFLMVIYVLEQETGRTFIEDNKVAFTTEELEKGFKFYTDLVANGVVPSMKVRAAAGNVPLDQHPAWIKGEFAGTYEWDSAAQKWQDSVEKGMKITVGDFPKDFGPYNSAFSKISMAFAINKNTKYPKEAAKFIEFLTSDPEGIKILKLARGIPGNRVADEVLKAEGILTGLSYVGNQKVIEFAGKPLSPKFENKNLQGLYRDTVEKLGYGQVNERQAAEIIVTKVNEFLASEK